MPLEKPHGVYRINISQLLFSVFSLTAIESIKETVKTSDIEYLTLMKEVTGETEKHKDSIERRIQEIKAEI